ncbi:MAG: (Fe-S)-binding protein [Acidobacteria bacterium]|nr:(Fe-S)-binding protein [Acidobacteriota bacterium]
MNPWLMTLALVLSFVGFGYFSHKRLSILMKLRPENRWQNAGARLANVLSLGIFQTRMLKGEWKAGLMHLVVFYGFSALLIRKIQLFVSGYDPFFVYPQWFGGPYAALKDAIELAVLVAVACGLYRRIFNRPQRLEPNKEAFLILSMIAVIMITDLLYDGFKFALHSAAYEGLAHEQAWAFAGNAISQQFNGMAESTLAIGYHASFWIQIFTVLTFLVIIPIGEHFHIVTALPTLFFSQGGTTKVVPKVDLESLFAEDADAEEPKVGIRTAMDLSWKDGLDAFTCTECGRCKTSCPTFLTDKPLSLKWVHDSVKHHLEDERNQIIQGEKPEETLPPLVGDIIKEDTLWACTTCGYCEWSCPIELQLLPKIYGMRQHKVMMDSEFPAELQDVFSNYERQGNPWGLNSATRSDWANGLDVPVLEDPADSEALDVLFYVGSAQSFDNRNQKVARAFVKILQTAGVKFAILGSAEGSTGECVRRAGNEMLFQELANGLIEHLNGLAVKHIVTCDPHAYNSLKNEYPEFGGTYRVVHHTEYIDELIRSKKIAVTPQFEKVIYHEPCYIGRHNGIYDQPRSIIQAVSKDQPLEFKLNREKAMCCGAGGGRMWMEETIGSRINVARVEQAMEGTQPQVIATACPYCTIMMTDGVAHIKKEETVQVKDIAELVAESLAVRV